MQALYRGNGTNVLRLVPDVAVKFTLNDQLRIMFTPSDGRPLGFDGKLAAGAATGILRVSLPPHSAVSQHQKYKHWEFACTI